MSNHPTIWALKIQPGGAEEGTNPYEFCKAQNPPIIGIGWGISEEFESAEEALKQHQTRDSHTDQWGNVKFPIRAMLKKASIGDLVWVNEGSEYALCRVKSDWKQVSSSATQNEDWIRNDIHNYRLADWRLVEPKFVPGYVKRYFSAPRIPTMARPDDGKNEPSKEYALTLFEKDPGNVGEVVDTSALSPKINNTTTETFFNILDPVETEDLVIDYLQSKGWHVVKSSTSKGQAGIECVLRRVDEEPETAYVQVKSGKGTIDVDEYVDLAHTSTVYLHQRHPPDSSPPDGINWIEPEKLKTYLRRNPGYIPDHTLLKLDVAL